MAIDGRITVDVLFHDTDGTASLKVVSLEDSTEYTSGKVAIVTGTVGTAAATVDPSATGYIDASGTEVTLQPESVALSASPSACTYQEDPEVGGFLFRICSENGRVAITSIDNSEPLRVQTTAGTASYTLVLYGS